MKLPLFCLALLAAVASAAPGAKHTCRILFLDGPDDAPRTLHLFDGATSREVDLPRLNLSDVYDLPGGPLTLRLLPEPPADPEKIPAGAPSVSIASEAGDFYLLLTSDPQNKIAPVKIRAIDASTDKLRAGQMLWFNLTQSMVGGTIGSEKLVLKPGTKVTLNPPAKGNDNYPVLLDYRIPGKESLYPLCETSWRHDPRSRSLAFVVPGKNGRTPRVMAFPDYREPEEDAEGAP
ncbi:hypothetical protein HAHE_01620 [Haloferula helveola]|uniref:Uncharacterized protein n=1 Tax=Haloferula helveola TaxID=490095 RepID=A0ABM7REU0_9BACT|nr:hypothetical protein HAHE_01620 [Haloferula helveola]